MSCVGYIKSKKEIKNSRAARRVKVREIPRGFGKIDYLVVVDNRYTLYLSPRKNIILLRFDGWQGRVHARKELRHVMKRILNSGEPLARLLLSDRECLRELSEVIGEIINGKGKRSRRKWRRWRCDICGGRIIYLRHEGMYVCEQCGNARMVREERGIK